MNCEGLLDLIALYGYTVNLDHKKRCAKGKKGVCRHHHKRSDRNVMSFLIASSVNSNILHNFVVSLAILISCRRWISQRSMIVTVKRFDIEKREIKRWTRSFQRFWAIVVGGNPLSHPRPRWREVNGRTYKWSERIIESPPRELSLLHRQPTLHPSSPFGFRNTDDMINERHFSYRLEEHWSSFPVTFWWRSSRTLSSTQTNFAVPSRKHRWHNQRSIV